MPYRMHFVTPFQGWKVIGGPYPWVKLQLPTAMVFQPCGLKKLRAVGLETASGHGVATKGRRYTSGVKEKPRLQFLTVVVLIPAAASRRKQAAMLHYGRGLESNQHDRIKRRGDRCFGLLIFCGVCCGIRCGWR